MRIEKSVRGSLFGITRDPEARFVKDAASVLIKPITHIVNLSIQTGIVPCELKNATVVPIFKKNKRSDVIGLLH